MARTRIASGARRPSSVVCAGGARRRDRRCRQRWPTCVSRRRCGQAAPKRLRSQSLPRRGNLSQPRFRPISPYATNQPGVRALLSGRRRNLSGCDFVIEVVRIEAVDPAFVRFSLRIHEETKGCLSRSRQCDVVGEVVRYPISSPRTQRAALALFRLTRRVASDFRAVPRVQLSARQRDQPEPSRNRGYGLRPGSAALW